ncbi:MAG: DUF4129 domain-containing protein [Kofleriaceae bacterium]
MRSLAVVVVVVLSLTRIGYAAEPRSVDTIEQARDAVLDREYQAQLPRYEDVAGQDRAIQGSGSDASANQRQANRSRRAANGRVGERDRQMIDTRERQSSQGSPFMAIVMWALVIVIVLLVVLWIASELSKYGGDPDAPAASESQVQLQAAVDAILDRPLGDADELARRGEYAEAIHTLLLRTLQELVKSASVRVAPAMTSREILARVPLLADARAAFADLITAVELTHFGDDPANAADYERCRRQFHVFAATLRGALPQPSSAGQEVAA